MKLPVFTEVTVLDFVSPSVFLCGLYLGVTVTFLQRVIILVDTYINRRQCVATLTDLFLQLPWEQGSHFSYINSTNKQILAGCVWPVIPNSFLPRVFNFGGHIHTSTQTLMCCNSHLYIISTVVLVTR